MAIKDPQPCLASVVELHYMCSEFLGPNITQPHLTSNFKGFFLYGRSICVCVFCVKWGSINRDTEKSINSTIIYKQISELKLKQI